MSKMSCISRCCFSCWFHIQQKKIHLVLYACLSHKCANIGFYCLHRKLTGPCVTWLLCMFCWFTLHFYKKSSLEPETVSCMYSQHSWPFSCFVNSRFAWWCTESADIFDFNFLLCTFLLDPLSMSPQKALETIGANLQKQYENWQPRVSEEANFLPSPVFKWHIYYTH